MERTKGKKVEKKKAKANLEVGVSAERQQNQDVVLCLECNTQIESKQHRDFQTCSCRAIFVDTSHNTLRFGFTPGKKFKRL